MAKRFLLIGILMSLIIAAGCSNTKKLSQKNDEISKINIGVILPLSGGSAALGEGARNAAQMAMQELQNNQDYKNDYQLIFEDDQLDPELSLVAYKKLTKNDNIRAIVSATSGPGNTIAPNAQSNQIIHFGVASDPKVAEGYFNFIHWTQPKQEAEKLITKIKKENLKSVVYIQLSQEGGILTVEELEKVAKNNNIEFNIEYVNGEETNFRTILLKLQNKKPDIFGVGLFSPQIENFIKQYKELGIKKPLTSIESFEYSSQPELFNGYWYVSSAEPADKFRTSYVEKYNITPSVGAANIYDIINILIWAYENVDDPTNNELVAQQIKTLKDWPGALGNLNITEEGIIISEAALKKVVDGEFVVVE